MENKLYQVDAFTDEPFKGNPAGVMIVENEPDVDFMQEIAMEMNLSETAFVVPADDHYKIRYFTPAQEVALCGHATLASAHILYELGVKKSGEPILFKAKVGDLNIHKQGNLIVMNFPDYTYKPIPIIKEFKSLVGFEPIEMYSSSYNWIIAVAGSEEEIANARPQLEAMTQAGMGHLMITAKSSRPKIDFVLRCFAPALGINEDPVTGSAHCALTPLWTEKLGNKELYSLQLSARTGLLRSEFTNGRVLLKGEAVTVFDIKLSTSI